MQDLWIQHEFFFQLAEIFNLSINSLQGRSKDALINIVNNLAYQLINKTKKKSIFSALLADSQAPNKQLVC